MDLEDATRAERLAYYMGGLTGSLASIPLQEEMVKKGVDPADIAALNKLLLKIATTLFYDKDKPQ